jgi:hypothetical protein
MEINIKTRHSKCPASLSPKYWARPRRRPRGTAKCLRFHSALTHESIGVLLFEVPHDISTEPLRLTLWTRTKTNGGKRQAILSPFQPLPKEKQSNKQRNIERTWRTVEAKLWKLQIRVISTFTGMNRNLISVGRETRRLQPAAANQRSNARCDSGQKWQGKKYWRGEES